MVISHIKINLSMLIPLFLVVALHAQQASFEQPTIALANNDQNAMIESVVSTTQEIMDDVIDQNALLEVLTTLLSAPQEESDSTSHDGVQTEMSDIPLRSFPIQPKRHITFLTYMAADNNLAYFAKKNLDQQAQIGSNNFINIVTELDTRLAGNQKVSKIYFVKKDQLVILNTDNPNQKMDSGDPETLIKFCRFAIKHFPADHYVLILNNHGMGIIDIGQYSAFNASKLFRYNPDINMLEIDRSMSYLELINPLPYPRGLCFDDSTGNYITNQGLEYALHTICNECLGGKKFDIIGFDACLMSMVEVGNILRDYADFMVGSQEVELALGWRYDTILAKAAQQKIPIGNFAQHIIAMYRDMYHKITKDYTLSVVALELLPQLEENINTVAQLLLDSLKLEKGTTVRDALKASRHRLYCTHFVEQSFVDLHHFYTNITNNMHRFQYSNMRSGKKINTDLTKALQQGISLIQKIVVANVVGNGLANARGISIYFPEQRIHGSYAHTKFARTNSWGNFLAQYIQL